MVSSARLNNLGKKTCLFSGTSVHTSYVLGTQYTTGRGFPSGSAVKNPPATQKTWVRSLGREDALEESLATRSGILAW